MHVKSLLGKVITYTMTMLVMLSMCGVIVAHADTGKPIDVTIKLETLNLSVAEFRDSTQASFEFDFSVPNEATEGDYTELGLPKELKLLYNEAFDVYAPDGTSVVAKATISSSKKALKLTYTDYVDKHSNVTGHMRIYEGVDTTVVKEETILPTEIIINGEVFIIDLPDELKPKYIPGNYEDKDAHSDFHKTGGFNNRKDRIINYNLYVNRSMSSVKNARVVDELSTEGVTLVDGSIKVWEGNYVVDESRNQIRFSTENRKDVTSDVKITVAEDKRSFTVELGDISKGYYITYQAKPNYNLVDGERVRNYAYYYSEQTRIGIRGNSVTWQEASGTAVGYNYSLTIKKVNEAGETLPNATFTVTRKANGEVIGTYTTGEDGTVTVPNLLQDKYTITETKAPDGYELATSVDEVANNNTVTIVDKKIVEEPPKDNTPETPKTEDPTPKVEEPTTKTEDPTPKAETPTQKLEEPAPKAEEPKIAKQETPADSAEVVKDIDKDDSSPKTADDTSLIIWTVLLISAVAAAAAMLRARLARRQ